MRPAVKDIYDIRGLATGVGSKAYARFHEISTQTAPVIQKLCWPRDLDLVPTSL